MHKLFVVLTRLSMADAFDGGGKEFLLSVFFINFWRVSSNQYGLPNRTLPIVTNVCQNFPAFLGISKDAISFRFNLGWYIDNDRFCGQFVGLWLCQSIGTCGGTGIFCLEPRMKSRKWPSMTSAPSRLLVMVNDVPVKCGFFGDLDWFSASWWSLIRR